MAYSIWLLRLITAFVVMTVKIKDHIYYGTKLESSKNTHSGWNLSSGRWAVKGYYKQISKDLSFLKKKKKKFSWKMEIF